MTVIGLDDNGEDVVVVVGGIAAINKGMIQGTYFNGDVTGNVVGGIVGTNSGQIDRCFVTEDSTITVTNRSNTVNTLRLAVGGGFAGRLLRDMNQETPTSITNSYSLGTVNIVKGGDVASVGAPYTVGGFVGTMINNANITIQNCYSVVKVKYQEVAGSQTIMIYKMIPAVGNVNASDNYYIVAASTEQDPSLNDVDFAKNGGGTDCDTLELLKTQLQPLKDEENNQVYTITQTGYPTLYQG